MINFSDSYYIHPIKGGGWSVKRVGQKMGDRDRVGYGLMEKVGEEEEEEIMLWRKRRRRRRKTMKMG